MQVYIVEKIQALVTIVEKSFPLKSKNSVKNMKAALLHTLHKVNDVLVLSLVLVVSSLEPYLALR